MSARTPSRRRTRPVPDTSLLGRLIDPLDRLSQTIYSVLVILTFTLAFRIFNLGGDPTQMIDAEYVNDLLIAALGATLAWGLIDGLMYALMEVFQRGERHRLLSAIQAAESEQEGVAVVAEELDYVLEPISGEAERRKLYASVYAQLRSGQPKPVGFKRDDLRGALGSFLTTLIAVLPSLAPFLVLQHDYALAIRASNVVSFIVLFIAGYGWGRHTGANPWRTGLLVTAVGAVTVAIAIPLGG